MAEQSRLEKLLEKQKELEAKIVEEKASEEARRRERSNPNPKSLSRSQSRQRQ